MPAKLAGGYGLKEMDKDLTALMQSFGGFLSAFAVWIAAYVSGMGATKAVGASQIPALLVQLDQMFVRKMSPEGLDQGPQYFWLAVNVAAIAFLLF